MIAQILGAVVVLGAVVADSAVDPIILTTDKTSRTDGYWITDQGYFVGCYHGVGGTKDSEAEPALVYFRLGLVHGGRLHPGPFAVGAKELQIIGPMSLVIRENETVVVRVPMKAEVDPGNQIHMLVQFNATAELVPKLEIEFEERLDSGTRTMRVPLKSFMSDR